MAAGRLSTRRLFGAAVIAVLSLAASMPMASGHAGSTTAARTADEQLVDAVTAPEINWRPCRAQARYDCARVKVPLDYDRPGGPTITLSLARRPANDQDNKIGSLFLNPGGPGGSGVDFVRGYGDRYLTNAIRDRFDLIGLDPRGVARSTPLLCFRSFAGLDAVSTSFSFPYSRAEEREWIASDRKVARRCDRNGGVIQDHMSTANVARDMDLLRRSLGDDTMNFAGYSYGSYLGATYAAMFPNRVRAVLIDGVIDPISYATGRGDDGETLPVDARLESEQGAYETLLQFLSLCDDAGAACAYSAGDPEARFAALTDQLLDDPIEIEDGDDIVVITYQDVVYNALGAMYNNASWSDFARYLRAIDRQAGREVVDAQAALDARLRPQTRAYSQTIEGFIGVWCDADNPDEASAWATAARAADRRYPYFGRAWIWGSSICAQWTGVDRDRYIGPFDVETANPLLVANATYDPATRYQDAVSTADIFPGAVLVTVNGSGHTTLELSACADRAIVRYLLTAEVPAADVTCDADVANPFLGGRDTSVRDWVTAQQRPGR